jgi:PDZ domain-containing protein
VAVLLVAAVVVVTIGVLNSWTVNEYAITPGHSSPVEPLVKVSGLKTKVNHDKILLTDVYVQQLTAWQYLWMHFQSHVQFYTGADLLDPGIPASELGPQGYLEMYDSKRDAEVSAFRELGWKLSPTPSGAIISGVVDPSPGWTVKLRVADDIVGFDTKPVTSSCQLASDVHDLQPNTFVTLHVRRAHISAAGTITWGAPHIFSLETAKIPTANQVSQCANVSGFAASWLGVSLEDGMTYKFPARVSIDTNFIGGPSAGLAMTLCLIDRFSKGSLTGGHAVAATGTIDQNGNVGDVGGVAEKTIAVENAGAHYFIVPQVEVATAKANASPGLHIIGVTTLHQALQALQRIGGAKPLPLTTPR